MDKNPNIDPEVRVSIRQREVPNVISKRNLRNRVEVIEFSESRTKDFGDYIFKIFNVFIGYKLDRLPILEGPVPSRLPSTTSQWVQKSDVLPLLTASTSKYIRFPKGFSDVGTGLVQRF